MTVQSAVRASSQFAFHTAKSILCEVGAARKVGHVLSESLGIRPNATVLIVSDKGITDRGLELGCVEEMSKLGLNVVLFDDVVADPPEGIVLDAVGLAKSVKAECVVGFGGGSPMDVAKLVSFLAHPTATQDINEIYGVGACKGHRLPLVQVPTTAGTGSEVTPISIITTGKNEKLGVVSPIILPDYAILDGELTSSLPSSVTAATGIDATIHAVEAYTSRFKKNPLSDLLARDALRLLGGNIRRVCANPDDHAARSDMLLGSMYAGMAFANAPVAAVHALAYPIGSHFHVPHGLSNALMLPHVLRFNNEAVGDLYEELHPIAFPSDASKSGMTLADSFEALGEELAVPRTLEQVGITEQDISLLVTESMKQTRLLPNNPRAVEPQDAEMLYRTALR